MANVKAVTELILDEQKIVTYVSLSKELCIHVNESKTLLELVVEEIKIKQPNIKLNVNFIVSGLLDDYSARTLVCSEPDLDVEKSKFRTLFYQHIYSVSLGSAGVDPAAIVSVNKFADLPLCTGLVKSFSCLKRSSGEIETLRSKNQATIDANISKAPLKNEVKEKPKDIHNGSDHSSDVVKAQTSKSEPIKSEVISPKKEKPSTSNGKANATNSKKPSKSIAGFFSKSNSVPNIKSAKTTQEPIQKQIKTEEKKNEEEEMDVDIEEEVPVRNVKEEPKSAKKDSNDTLKNSSSKGKETESKSKNTSKRNTSTGKSVTESPKKSKKNSSLSKIKKTAKVDKTRKRVLRVSDSESDEDPFADDKPTVQESDDEIPPTPVTNTVKITSGILNPKKRRKVVDKTYTDEDGYILTRKEEIYESCSDDEVEIKQPEVKVQKENVEIANKITKTEVSPKEKKAKNSKKKISPPQKGKQSTMMNFFKKV